LGCLGGSKDENRQRFTLGCLSRSQDEEAGNGVLWVVWVELMLKMQAWYNGVLLVV